MLSIKISFTNSNQHLQSIRKPKINVPVFTSVKRYFGFKKLTSY